MTELLQRCGRSFGGFGGRGEFKTIQYLRIAAAKALREFGSEGKGQQQPSTGVIGKVSVDPTKGNFLLSTAGFTPQQA